MFDFFFFFKQKTAYEMRISDWSSDVCSSDLRQGGRVDLRELLAGLLGPGLELLLADHLDHDRHEGVAGAAELGALAVEGLAGELGRDVGPGLVDASRHGVGLQPARRPSDAGDDGARGDPVADVVVDWQHQRGWRW